MTLVSRVDGGKKISYQSIYSHEFASGISIGREWAILPENTKKSPLISLIESGIPGRYNSRLQELCYQYLKQKKYQIHKRVQIFPEVLCSTKNSEFANNDKVMI